MIDFNVFQNSRFIEPTRQASYGVLAAITWNSKTIRSRTFWTDGRRLLVDLLRPPDWRVTCQTRPWTTSMSVPRSRTFGRFRTHRRRLVRVRRTWTLSSYWLVWPRPWSTITSTSRRLTKRIWPVWRIRRRMKRPLSSGANPHGRPWGPSTKRGTTIETITSGRRRRITASGWNNNPFHGSGAKVNRQNLRLCGSPSAATTCSFRRNGHGTSEVWANVKR